VAYKSMPSNGKREGQTTVVINMVSYNSFQGTIISQNLNSKTFSKRHPKEQKSISVCAYQFLPRILDFFFCISKAISRQINQANVSQLKEINCLHKNHSCFTKEIQKKKTIIKKFPWEL
jgi:hypothetical protein